MPEQFAFSRETSSVDVALTGRPTQTTGYYSCFLRYKYHCIRATTGGPRLLGAALGSCAITFLDIWSTFQAKTAIFMKLISVVGVIVVACLGMYGTIPFEIAFYCCAGVAGYQVLTLFIDIPLYFAVDVPLQIVWEHALVARTDINLGSGNDFLRVTAKNRTQYLATDLETHILAADLVERAEVTIMLYRDSWYNRNGDIKYVLSWLAVGSKTTAYFFVFAFKSLQDIGFLHKLSFSFLHCIIPLGSLAIMFFLDSEYYLLPIATLVAACVWALLLGPLVYAALLVVALVANCALLGIPGWITSSIYKAWERSMVANANTAREGRYLKNL
ncbi:hypothetical protein PTSG_06286 [Salpingoeca rosetta]|uniref:Uncharacterized protein n=1 Tax=Salpingoeca rosetta (strain ATCC 50818 / BSB-021) TaxID=946362 RepID=F2UCH0_SALR5|nr:uncharacterized protein PTSG_06286 [Salpingoeca rosetta]EGD74277.1 hypothetical protein PTSG_06286 [Salpingoeca rosetta]|eukprot:XP_004993177.1 hypothetical protein PTSG_06286 [Salpingoeca rosetta]